MKTRIELWKEYRQDINSNVNLQKSVLVTNQKLHNLYQKLLKTYPEYEAKYPLKNNNILSRIDELPQFKEYNLENLKTLIDNLQNIEFNATSFKAIDNFDFSSHQLDQVKETIKNKKVYQKKQVLFSEHKLDIEVAKAQKISLTKENTVISKIKHKFNIAIDGPSGSGKSTIAKLLAQKYNLNYINTGLVYRAMALHAKNLKADFEDSQSIIEALKSLNLKLLPNEEVILNKKSITLDLKTDDISQKASAIGVIPEVRMQAQAILKRYALEPGTVMDGRDTTFKIMPHAEIKIFLDTKPEIRAKRRVKQNQEFGFKSNYENILAEIKERDYRDRNRKIDPLHLTKDATLIDASDMTIEQIIDRISEIIKQSI